MVTLQSREKKKQTKNKTKQTKKTPKNRTVRIKTIQDALGVLVRGPQGPPPPPYFGDADIN